MAVIGAPALHNQNGGMPRFKYNPGDSKNGIELLYRISNGKHPKGMLRCHCGRQWVGRIDKVFCGDNRSCGCDRQKTKAGDVNEHGITLIRRVGLARCRLLCHCGREWGATLSSFHDKQCCGCLRPKYKNTPGESFNGIEYLERLPNRGRLPMGRFRCHCGRVWVTELYAVTCKDGIKSCGCLHVNPRTEHPANRFHLPFKFLCMSDRSYVIVPAELYEYLNQWLWTATGKGYGRTWIHGKLVALHNLIWMKLNHKQRIPSGYFVDHANRNPRNNMPDNLRLANPSQQGMNCTKRRDNTSGYIGVNWSVREQQWEARVRAYRKVAWRGYFADPFSAAWVRDEKAREIHGEFAVTNNLTDRRVKSLPVAVERRQSQQRKAG